MKLESIEHEPVFIVTFTKEEVNELTLAAQVHYDATCRSLAEVGGIIYGLNNALALELLEGNATASLKWRDIDLLCKVLERTMPQLYWQLRNLLINYKPVVRK